MEYPFKKQLVFGLGTGRCGTYSLKTLLNSQPDSHIGHEIWSVPSSLLHSLGHYLKGLIYTTGKATFVGDVAYYLLPSTEEIIGLYPEAKFIFMWHDMDHVVNSFMKRTPKRNYWTRRDSIYWDDEAWGATQAHTSFPQYDLPKKEALEQYWKDWHALGHSLQKRYEENIIIRNIQALNSKETQAEMLDFIGIPKDKQVTHDPNYMKFNKMGEDIIEITPLNIAPEETQCWNCRQMNATHTVFNRSRSLLVHACDECMKPGQHLGVFGAQEQKKEVHYG